MLMETAQSPTQNSATMTPFLVEQYARAAWEAGVPRDQLENFMRAGIVLQPKQLAMSAAARLCDAEDGPVEIGVGGARGPGKSFWGLTQISADDCQRFPGLKFLYLRKVGKSIRESFEDLRVKVLANIPHDYNKGDGVIRFENDSRIVLGHFQNESDIDAYLGIEYDGALVEETTTLTSAKYRAIGTCVRSSKSFNGWDWRPRIYNTTNPGNIGHAWYKERFIKPFRAELDGSGKQLRTRFVPALVDDNAFVDKDYRNKLEELTGWQRRAWLFGDWDIAAGQFFTTFRVEKHVVKRVVIEDSMRKAWRFWGALDYGFTHFTVFHLFAKDGDGNIFVLDEHAERGWLAQRHVPAIHNLLARNNLKLGDLRVIVTGPDCFAKKNDGATVAETYRQLGIKLRPANVDRINGAAEILTRLGDPDEVDKLHALPERTPDQDRLAIQLTPKMYVCEPCRMLIDQLPSMQHDPHRPEDVLKVDCDEDGIGGDDAYDTCRMGVMVDWKKPKRSLRVI